MKCETSKWKEVKNGKRKGWAEEKGEMSITRRWAKVLWNSERLLLFHKHVIKTAQNYI